MTVFRYSVQQIVKRFINELIDSLTNASFQSLDMSFYCDKIEDRFRFIEMVSTYHNILTRPGK